MLHFSIYNIGLCYVKHNGIVNSRLLFIIALTILYRRTSFVENYGTPVVRLPSEAIDALSMSLEEVDALTRANETCPICFGRDACDELMSDVKLGRLKVDRLVM